MFDPRQEVYSVKSVAVIPLVESRARDTLKALALRNHAKNRPSLVPAENFASGRPSLEDASAAASQTRDTDLPRVKFASEEQVRVMTPLSAHGFEDEQNEGREQRWCL